MTEAEIQRLVTAIAPPFYQAADFWISFLVGVAGLIFSIKAFAEARAAKEAAKHAGRTVKLQTVALELTETSNKLDRVEPDIKYRLARDLLSETSRRITRSISAFANDEKLKESIAVLKQTIEEAVNALNQVRPISPGAEDQAPQAVYNAVEAHFARINNCVADLVGLIEQQSTNIGE